ncbi:MAG TPA: hypothetical protein VMU98_06060 [Acidimicrobiales bacterium]|nr:hypothetical protein [Acidimicrobiales bacterium]
MTLRTTPSSPGRRFVPLVLLAVLVVLSAVAAVSSYGFKPTSNVIGPEGVVVTNDRVLAPSSSSATGAPVDGVTCRKESGEVVKYHVHVYVTVFVNGRQRRLPAGIGITRPYLTEHLSSGNFLDVGLYDCLYWLHTHVADGIVHIEAPAKATFTLGQLFDIWRQPLSNARVGPAVGHVVVYENGRQWRGDPRGVPLLAHGVIQLDVGTPVVAFQPFEYHVSGLCGAGTTSCAAPTQK